MVLAIEIRYIAIIKVIVMIVIKNTINSHGIGNKTCIYMYIYIYGSNSY